ncbi:hypothetical protein C0389_03345 [bacterium]|nr:hypothetical protein [bacterium]
MFKKLGMFLSKISVVLLFTTIVLNNSFAQNVEITIKNQGKGKAFISSLSGEKTTLIDSVNSIDKGIFRFSIDKNKYHTGIYRLTFGQNKWMDFINDGGEISITTHSNNILDSLEVTHSESNKLFYIFLRLNKQYKTKTELLLLILSRYPRDDQFYLQTKNRLIELQNEYLQFVNYTSQMMASSFVAKYIRSSQLPAVDVSIQIDKQFAYLKAHALDKVDFNNSLLINTDLYSNKTIEYLTYYRNPQLPLELLEKEFMIAVDSLFNKARVNQLVYQHITEYLIDGFKKFGFDKVLDYIVENYVIKDDLCLDVKTEGLIKRRIDQARDLKIGKTAPNIILPDNSGSTVSLKNLKADKTLIVFYASWCPHCKELLPKLNEVYKSQKVKKFEVLAVSLDSKKEDWLEFIKTNCPTLINISDLEGWDGETAANYFIYATPTMFVIDRELKVISKPMTVEDVKKIF